MHSPRLRSTCDPHRSGKSNFCAASGRHAISPWRDYGDQTGISACSKSGRAETARDDSFEQQRLLSLSADRRKESRNAPRSSKNTSSCGPRVRWARAAGYTHLLDWPLDDQQIWMQTGAGPLLSPLSDGIERCRRAGASRSHRPPIRRDDRRPVRGAAGAAAATGACVSNAARCRPLGHFSFIRFEWLPAGTDGRGRAGAEKIDGRQRA